MALWRTCLDVNLHSVGLPPQAGSQISMELVGMARVQAPVSSYSPSGQPLMRETGMSMSGPESGYEVANGVLGPTAARLPPATSDGTFVFAGSSQGWPLGGWGASSCADTLRNPLGGAVPPPLSVSHDTWCWWGALHYTGGRWEAPAPRSWGGF